MGKGLLLKSGSSGVDPDGLTAKPEDVLKGKLFAGTGSDEPLTGTLALTGTAGDSQVLAGSTYYNSDAKTKRTGTMTNRGAVSQTLNCGGSYTIPAGYHNGGGKVTANSLASQTSANATAAYISSGKTAWVNGSKLTGTLAIQGGSTTTPGTSNKTIVSASKHVTGNIIVAGSGNLTAGNIKKGVNIFGVTGTWNGYVPSATDLYLRGNNVIGFTTTDFDTLQFDSGQITKRGSLTVSSTLSVKSPVILTGYSNINFEVNITSFSSTLSASIALLLVRNDSTSTNIGSCTLSSKGTFITSINLSAAQVTSQIMLNMRGWNGAIYRIWLS